MFGDHYRPHPRGLYANPLDSFKAVNDTLARAAGDGLLTISADRVRGVIRDEDIVGRIGGDEFLIMSPGMASPEQAMTLARRVAEALCQDVDLAGSVLASRASIGVAWSVGDSTDAEALVAEADNAMYESKRESSGQPKLAHLAVGQTPDRHRGSATAD